jgi:hypothetical protein
MAVNRNIWRAQQFSGIGLSGRSPIILQQEKIMLDFLLKFPEITWKWAGDESSFKEICKNYLSLDNHVYTGIIIFGGILSHLSTPQLIEKIQSNIQSLEYAYIGINRYEIVNKTTDSNLPDSIDDSLDYILQSINPKIKRLHTFDKVTGDQMVGVHPMDCYGLCK